LAGRGKSVKKLGGRGGRGGERRGGEDFPCNLAVICTIVCLVAVVIVVVVVAIVVVVVIAVVIVVIVVPITKDVLNVPSSASAGDKGH
jgi:Flp pilus assembly protein TadB